MASIDPSQDQVPQGGTQPGPGEGSYNSRLRFLKYRDVGGGDFDPSTRGCVEEWLDSMERYIADDGEMKGVVWPERLKHSLIADRLKGRAAKWYSHALKGLKPEERTDTIKADMIARAKRTSETWQEYSDVLYEMAEGITVPEAWLVACFTKGVDPAAAKDLHMSKVTTMLEGVQLLQLLYGPGNGGMGTKTTRAYAATVQDQEKESEEEPRSVKDQKVI
ncbi:hypothetical protein AaE_015404, partial [Aphanomyces astaci]